MSLQTRKIEAPCDDSERRVARGGYRAWASARAWAVAAAAGQQFVVQARAAAD